MKSSRALALFLSAAFAFHLDLRAAEIAGTIRSVSGSSVTVIPQGDLAPNAGDKAEVFFKLPGMDEEVSVAGCSVTKVERDSIELKIENATGEVAKDQLVRIQSEKPQKRDALVAAATPATANASATGGYIGVNLTTALDGVGGALVMDVSAEGPAATAGLRPNDLIVALDGSPVANPGELAAAVAQLLPGTSHAFLFSRAGKTQKADVLIQTRPVALAEAQQSSSSSLPSPSESLPPPLPSQTATPKVTTTSAAEIDPAAARHFNEGIAKYSAGDMDGAIASYSAALRIAPSLAVAYLNRGSAYLYKPDYKAALADANKALELKVAKTDDAYTIRGTAKAGLGDYDAGIADCTRALKINPQHALAYNNRGNNKLRKRDYKGALGDCNKSIALDSAFALPYYNRGFAYFNLGNTAGALSDWKTAVRLQTSFGAELNPKIVQLEAQGAQAKQAAAPKAPTGPAAGEWVDLTNARQKMIGTWQGGRHRTRYFADGTFVTDPHLVPDAPRGQWQVQGDRLLEFYPQANQTVTHQILSLDGKTLVIRNAQGETFRKSRIAN